MEIKEWNIQRYDKKEKKWCDLTDRTTLLTRADMETHLEELVRDFRRVFVFNFLEIVVVFGKHTYDVGEEGLPKTVVGGEYYRLVFDLVDG